MLFPSKRSLSPAEFVVTPMKYAILGNFISFSGFPECSMVYLLYYYFLFPNYFLAADLCCSTQLDNGCSVHCFHPGENCHETPGNEKITDCDDPQKTNFLTSNQYQCRHSFEQYIY